MKRCLILGAIGAALALPQTALAGPLYDFSTLSAGGKVTSLGTGTSTIGPVSAQAFYFNGAWVAGTLIARNEGGLVDDGLGVCSPGDASHCSIGSTGGGDWNELSQLTDEEAILFSLAPGWTWSELWISSLDSGGTGDSEEGRLYFGNSSDVATLLTSSSFDFTFGELPQVYGDVLTLASSSSFDPTARYLLWRPDGANGDNNDYLVWGASATQTVPEPASMMLFGVGLAGLVARRRKA
jgi:hypothetical protein